MAELKYFDAGSGTWKSVSVSTPPEVYVGIDPPAPRDQQLLWVDPDESPPAIARDITMDSWHLIGATGEPAFQNSWANSAGASNPAAGFRKFPDGRVRLNGMMFGGASGSVAFTLPIGYRPPKDGQFTVNASGGLAQVTIWNDGTVRPTNVGSSAVASMVNLSGIEFDTESVSSVTSVVAQPMEPWHTVGAVGEPVFQNSWVNYGGAEATAGFRKYPDGRVRLRGTIKNGTAAAAFTLPPGYRPPTNLYFPITTNSGAGTVYGNVTIGADGSVGMSQTATLWASLADIEFDTETVNNWTPASLPPNIIPLDLWHNVGAAGEPAFQNGWVNYDTRIARFRKYDDGRVRLEGIIKSGTVATAAFTLPVGYRPVTPAELYFPCVSNAVFCQVNIAPNGNVVVGSTFSVWLDLSGIEFDAGSSALGVTSSVAQPMDTWHTVGGPSEPLFQNSWVSYDAGVTFQVPKFRKYPDGRVKLAGSAKSGASGSVMFTLPAGYRPPKVLRFNIALAGGIQDATSWGQVNVYSDGTVVAWGINTTIISLDGIEFDTETVSAYTVGAIPSPRMPVVSSLPTSPAPVAGDMVLMMPSNIPYYYDGTAWKAWVGSGGGGGGTGAFAFFMGDD